MPPTAAEEAQAAAAEAAAAAIAAAWLPHVEAALVPALGAVAATRGFAFDRVAVDGAAAGAGAGTGKVKSTGLTQNSQVDP